MKYPEKGTIVIIKWFDAFEYKNDDEEAIRGRTDTVKTTIGQWKETYTTEKYGKSIEYCDIRNEWSNGGEAESDGTKIPTNCIISIEEYDPKNGQCKYYTTDTVTNIFDMKRELRNGSGG